MLNSRRTRLAGFVTLGVIVSVALVAKGCSSEPKKPEPPPKSSGPALAKGDTTTAKPGEPRKPVETAKAMPPVKAPEPAKPAPTPAKPAPEAEPAPVAPVAARGEEPKPVPGEPTPPPKPGKVNIPPPPPAPPDPSEGPAGARPPVEPTKPPVEPTKPPVTPAKPPVEPTRPPVEPTRPPVTPAKPPVEPGRAPEVVPPMVPKIKSPDDMAHDDAMKKLGALSEEKRIALEKQRFLVEDYLDKGDGAFKALKFEDAKQWAQKALDEQSDNAAARNLLNRARAALGERTGEVADMARSLADEARVKREMVETQARTMYDQGKAAMAAGDYDGAAKAFDGVLATIGSSPYEISWGRLPEDARARLADARSALSKQTEQARRKQAEEAYRRVKQEELDRRLAESKKRRALLTEAIDAYDHEDFARAEELGRQALEIDPRDVQAKDVVQAANKARHGQTMEQTRQTEKEKFRRWKDDMLETAIPYSGIVRGPSAEYWDRITRLRKDLGQISGSAEEAPETTALKNRLKETRTTFNFEATPLSRCIEYLASYHSMNIVVHEQVRADADAQNITLRLTDIDLESALKLLLKSATGLTYRVQGSFVVITKPELAREEAVVKIHPVGDLTMKLNNFIPPNLILKPAGAEADEANPVFGGQTEGQAAYGAPEDLIALIKENVGDSAEAWTAEGIGIDAHGDNILVVAPPEMQAGVDRFLNDLRKFSGLVVNIEARFLSVTDNFLRDVGVDIRGLGGEKGVNSPLDDVTNGLDDGASGGLDNGGPGNPAAASGKPSSGAFFNDLSDGDYKGRTEHIFDRSLGTTLSNTAGAILQWTLIDDTQLSVIWRAVQKKQEARVLQAPNLTVYNTQRANITLINQLAFIQDFDVEVAQTAFIADPIVSIIQDGLALDVRPVVSNDRRYVTLQLQPTIATLKRPIPTFTTSLGAFTTPVTLQLPELTLQKAQTTVRVPNGGTLLIGGLKNISLVDLKSETPWLSKIPIISFFFSRRGSSQEFSNLLILIRARIADLSIDEARVAR